MIRSLLIILVAGSLIVAAILVNHHVSKLNIDLEESKILNIRLNKQLRQTLQDKELFKEQVQQSKKQAEHFKPTQQTTAGVISQISDPKTLSRALVSAQDNIKQLNQQVNYIKSEKEVLQEANLNMSHRLQNTTGELMRLIEESKQMKQQIARIKKSEIPPLKEEIRKLNKSGQLKNHELNKLEKELEKLQKEREFAIRENDNLAKEIKDLRQERDHLEKVSDRLKKDIDQQTQPIISLQNDLGQLKKVLANKENQVKSLELELAELYSSKSNYQENINRQKTIIGDLGTTNNNLKAQINKITKELNQKQSQLDSYTKQTPGLKQEIVRLQSSIASLEDELNLPLHVPLPSVRKEDKVNSKK